MCLARAPAAARRQGVPHACCNTAALPGNAPERPGGGRLFGCNAAHRRAACPNRAARPNRATHRTADTAIDLGGRSPWAAVRAIWRWPGGAARRHYRVDGTFTDPGVVLYHDGAFQ